MDNNTQSVAAETPKWVKDYKKYLRFVLWSIPMFFISLILLTIYTFIKEDWENPESSWTSLGMVVMWVSAIAVNFFVFITTLGARKTVDNWSIKVNQNGAGVTTLTKAGTILMLIIQALFYIYFLYAWIIVFGGVVLDILIRR